MKSHVVFYLIKRLKKELTKHCKPFMGWVRIMGGVSRHHEMLREEWQINFSSKENRV